jgi:hypothetical protein
VGEQGPDRQLADGPDVHRVGGVVGWHRHRDPLRAGPAILGELGEDPAVGGVGDGVHRRPPDGTVVGRVPRTGDAATPVLAVVLGDDDVGPLTADRRGEVAAEGEVLDDSAIRVAEELDLRDADDRATGALLGLPRDARLGRPQRVDAGLARRHQDVRDVPTGRRPGGDGTREAPLDVVGVGDDHGRPLPAGRELGQRHRRALSPPSTTSV